MPPARCVRPARAPPLSLRARTRERHRSNLMRQLAVRSASRLTVNAIPPGDVGF